MKTKTRSLIAVLVYFVTQAAFAFYNPEIGRWANRDPIGEWGGVNLYQAFLNAPADNIDISGLWVPGVHDQIIDESLGDFVKTGLLSQQDLGLIKSGSRYWDKVSQKIKFSHTHCMRRPCESAAHAKKRIDDFISRMLAEARENEERGNHIEALTDLAIALHTMMDCTSPMHTKPNGDPKAWYYLNGLLHGNAGEGTGVYNGLDSTTKQQMLDRMGDAYADVFLTP